MQCCSTFSLAFHQTKERNWNVINTINYIINTKSTNTRFYFIADDVDFITFHICR